MDLLKVKEMVAVLHFICVPEHFALFVICIYSSFRSPGFLFLKNIDLMGGVVIFVEEGRTVG